MANTPEGEIVRAICEYLSRKRYLFYRNNNVPIFDPTRQAFRAMPKYTMRGIPDIVLIKEGRYIGIEAKAGKAALSPHQEMFKAESERHGATYIVARSIDDVMAAGL